MTTASTAVRKDLVDFADVMKDYNPKTHISKNILTIYERTSILSLRMEQLANGAPSYLDLSKIKGVTDIRKVAEIELKEKKIPFMVCRKLPNGKKEYWRLDDLIIL